jgi:hypothetical protein
VYVKKPFIHVAGRQLRSLPYVSPHPLQYLRFQISF